MTEQQLEEKRLRTLEENRQTLIQEQEIAAKNKQREADKRQADVIAKAITEVLTQERKEEIWTVRKGVTRGIWFFFWEFLLFLLIVIPASYVLWAVLLGISFF